MDKNTRLTCCLLVIAAGLALTGHAAMASETLPGPIPADIVRVIDGDTVEVRAHIWLGQIVTIRIRLAEFDAPELFRPGCEGELVQARRAIDFVVASLADGGAGPWPVLLFNVTQGSFAGRAIAQIQLPNGRDLGVDLHA